MTGTDAPPQQAPRDALDRLGVPMPGPATDSREAVDAVSRRIASLVRLFLAPTVVVTGLVAPDVHPAFWAVIAAHVAWRSATRGPGSFPLARRPLDWLSYAIDVATLCALMAASGGYASPLRLALMALPFVGGFLVSPRAVAAVGAGTVAAYLLAALPGMDAASTGADSDVFGVLVLLVFATSGGAIVSAIRAYATVHIDTVDAARRRLLATGMGAEDRERRRVSQQLHGDALQLLLAAAQDLDERTSVGLRRARDGVRAGISSVRDTVRDLHPTTLRHAGLEPALRAALEHRVPNVISTRVVGEVDARRESMLLALVREIGDTLAALDLGDGVTARVATEGGRPVLTLGTACTPGSLAELETALGGCAERVDADGGQLTATLDAENHVRITALLGPTTETSSSVTAAATDSALIIRRSQLVFTGSRLLAAPVAVGAALVNGEPTPAFFVFIGVAALLDAATVAVLALHLRVPVPWLMGAATLCSAAALTQQGDVTTPIASWALSLPFLLVVTFGPRGIAGMCGLILVVLAVGFAPSVLDGTQESRASAFVLLAAYGWAVASSVVMANGRSRLVRRRAALERGRRRLLHDGLGVADAERRRLSESLHDGALQELMIASQDIAEAIGGDADALVAARVALRTGVDQLREAVTDLHPPALEHGGLRPALTSVVERACRRSDVHTTIEVDPRALGQHDELVINLVRELATNTCKHARAARLTVTVDCVEDRLELIVRDDGVGTSPARIAAAVTQGHIGLAASRERVEAEGGTLVIDSVPGRGATVTASLPVTEAGPTLPAG